MSIRIYSHLELSVLLFPNIQLQSASRQLTRWIQRDPELLADLLANGYTKRQRIFTPKQAEILFEHFGIEVKY